VARKRRKLTKKQEQLILDEMIKGKDPTNIFEDNSKELPSIRTFYRHQLEDTDFREQVDQAYTIQYQQMKAKLNQISQMSALAVLEKFGTLAAGEDPEFKSAAEFKKSMIDTYKFELGKLAGTFSRRYDKKTQIEMSGELSNQTTFVLPNYIEMAKKLADHKVIDIKDDDTE